MTITYDLYKKLQIDRSWDEDTIKSHLKEIQKNWIRKQSACNDKEQLLLIDEVLSVVEEGYRYLIKALKRKQYDEALEKAYKDGIIKDETEEKLKSLIEQASEYYRRGNIKLAAKCAQEAIDGQVNDPTAYDILARCQFDVENYGKALEIIDSGTGIFKDDLNLHWLGARIATVGAQDYDDAQRRVNTLLEIAPDRAIGHSEQVYLHLRKGDEELAYQEIDKYIEEHPTDEEFKRGVAYDLDSYSNSCYYYDAVSNSTFIADKESYNKCLNLRTKAVEIYNDEYTSKQLENAKFFGQKEFNSWNTDSMKTLSIYGILFLLLGTAASAFAMLGGMFLAVDAVLMYFSYRPYWQINKTYVTGQMGALETLVNKLGSVMAQLSYTLFHWLIKAVIALIKFCIWICTGGPFR